MLGRTLLFVLLALPAARAAPPPPPQTPGCPLQNESPAWMASRVLTDGLHFPPLSHECQIASQPSPDTPVQPNGMPSQYYPDPTLQRDYMLMAPHAR